MRSVILLGFAVLAATPTQAAPWPPARNEVFAIAGTLGLTIDGDIALAGRFDLDLEVAAGTATIRRLTAEIDDFVLVSEGFLGFFSTRTPFRCNQGAAAGPIAGALAGDSLVFPSRAAQLVLASREARDAAGACPPDVPSWLLEVTNTGPLYGRHDPAGNRFLLAGSFTTTVDGRSVAVEIALAGTYRNRPPLARIASEGPGLDFSQGGCPGSEPNAPAVEANAPGGLDLSFRSLSWDPDGPFPGADLTTAQWEHFDGRAVAVLGLGETVGTRHFGLGGPHTVALTVFDRTGAAAVASCSFQVADTRPPVLGPPGWLWTPCTTATGASPGTSPALASWLGSFTVADVADPSPNRLAPRVGGFEVTAATNFPAGAWTPVAFSARDAAGNVGSVWDWVWVASRPELVVGWANPPSGALYGSGKWVPVDGVLATPGCGYASLALVAVRSNGPEPIAALVSGVSFDFPDTSFVVKAAPVAKPGGTWAPRVYEFEYRATGLDGQVTTVVSKLTVTVP